MSDQDCQWRNEKTLRLLLNVDQNNISRVSAREVARQFGCDKSTIVKWAARFNIILSADNYRRRGAESRPALTLGDKIKQALNRGRQLSVVELADRFDVAPKIIIVELSALKENCVLVESVGNKITLGNEPAVLDKPLVIDNHKHAEQEFAIGVTADNHIGSKYERMDVLNSLYDRFADYGVKTVYQGGNIIDGECKFNQHDIYVHGVSAQVDNLIKKWPARPGIITQFVTGDDHEGWWVQREHIDIGQVIEDAARKAGREDLIHLGYMERDIEYKQPGGRAIIRVIHAGGGSSYAISYSSQKYVESLQGGEKPDIVLAGHFHKYDHSYPREVHVIQPGCTEDQTPFMRKRKLQAMIGGVVLWVKQNDIGIFTSVKVEFLPYYDKKFYQYKW